LMCRKISN